MKFRWIGSIGLVSALALSACGAAGNGAASPRSAEGNGAAEGEPVVLQVEGTDTLRFEPDQLNVPADTAFTVAFSNPSNQPHNFVLVEPGQEQAAQSAADAEGNIDEDAEGVINAGEVLQGGEDEEIEFEGLSAGEYTYICTVPGHLQAGMQGTLSVE